MTDASGDAARAMPQPAQRIRDVVEERGSAINPSNRAFWIGFAVVVLSLVSAFASYFILTGLTAIAPRNDVVLTALAINVVLILAMLVIVAWQAWGLRRAWIEKTPGARLHIRIVVLFSIIAALPAILLAVAATTTFSRSLDGWFSGRTRAIIENSYDVAKTYAQEHGLLIRNDLANMKRDIDGSAAEVGADEKALQNLLIGQAGLRDLPAAYIIDRSGAPVLMAVEDIKLPYVVPSEAVMKEAEAGQIPILGPDDRYRMAAVVKLDNFPGRFLYAARGVSPKVIGHLQRTEQNVYEYERLRGSKRGLKIAHGLIYFMISTTGLLAAIWAGLWFAGRFVAPIRRLIRAASEVSGGNLDVALPERRGEGDLRRLSQTFNTMTRELKRQQDALVTANAQLTERRNFIEAVLSGVSAGVIGVDGAERIKLVSRSAESLLGLCSADLVGRKVSEALPAFGDVIAEHDDKAGKAKGQREITIPLGSEDRTFAVNVTREGDVGFIVTFDDITELVVAQRTSAWADVARRIAHEIKNPLTPIQLSAERIRRKYGRAITEDRETFDKLTETIERQAGHIKSMVDEFAQFARMPKPQMEDADLREAIHEPLVLFRESHANIVFKATLPNEKVAARIDRRLMSQAVTNLVKNASESIEAAEAEHKAQGADYRGLIEIRLVTTADTAAIEVIDNGIGLPKQNRTKLLEPYVTTRAKGTGLGLAIVHKIVEQHGGTLALDDAPVGPGRARGALVRITLPLTMPMGAITGTDRRPLPLAAGGE